MKKLMFKILEIFTFSLLLLSIFPAVAQKQLDGFTIYGSVADSTNNQALSFLTISLETANAQLIKTRLTDTGGFFQFVNLKPASYQIVVKGLGIKSKRFDVIVKEGNYNLGRILIARTNSNLKEVKITATKPLIRQELDRVIYDLEADPDSKSNSVLDMLPRVPFLSLDVNENILLQGSGSYKILINGKPSGMMDRNAKEVLRSMPASSILRVEVITNPPSKYDAEGLAGVINIVTKKRADDGYNGNVNTKYRYPVGGPGIGGSFAFKQNKVAVSSIAGASLNNTPESVSTVKRISGSSSPSYLDQNNYRSSDNKTAYMGSEFSYEVDKYNLISAQVNISGNGKTAHNKQLSQKSNLEQFSELETNNRKLETGTSMDLSLDYQRDFKNSKDRVLLLSYRFLGNRNNISNELDSLTYTINSESHLQHNLGTLAEHSFQTDYTQALGKTLLETGLKGILRDNSSNFNNSQNAEKTLSSNNFTNKQYILSFYNSVQYKYKSWGIKAGFRLEQTLINASFERVESELNKSYLSFIPSIILGKKLGTTSNLSLSYTTRVQRPGISELNPFIDRSNPEFIYSGNPNLNRGYTHVFKLDYYRNKKANLNISLGTLLLRNMIGQISTYDEQNKITLTTFENTSSANVYKTNIFLNYPVSKQIRIILNTDFRYITSEFKRGNEMIRNGGFLQNVNLNGNYSLPSRLQLSAGFTFNSKGFSSVQNRTNGYCASSFGITKDIFEKKLSFSANVSNPFTKLRINREEIKEAGFWQLSNQHSFYRSFSMSINYRFGKLKESVKKSKRGIVNDDLN